MTRQLAYTRAYVDRDAGGEDVLRFVGATEGEKGDGISLRMDGAMLDRYRSNPIFGWGHRYGGRDSLPIGRSDRTEVDDKKRLMFDIAFDREDAFAAEVERKYRARFLNAVSIGFAVLEWEDPKTQDYWRGGVATQWELYELSAVPLPMDASAVVESGRALDDALLESVRGLLDRLDPAAITQLRGLLDSVGRLGQPPAAGAAPARSGTALATARRRARLAGV